MDTREQLEQIRAEAEAAMENAASLQELDAVRVKYLGKKGELTAVLKTMGKLSPEERPVMGQMANAVRATIEEKLEAIVTKIYRGAKVELTANAKKQAKQLTELGYGSCPICMAKTQYSFSDNQALLGAPEGFKVTVKNVKVSAGAGFVVVLTGDILTMPGLPKSPAAERIDVDDDGKISGLF